MIQRSPGLFFRSCSKLLTRPQEVAEKLNSLFVDKVENIVQEHSPDPVKFKMCTEKYMQRKYVETMNFRPVECLTVKKIIHQLKNTGAVGTDGISVLLLKKDVLAPFITWIINLSIMSFK